MKGFVNYFIKHSVITNWLMVVICLAGVFGLFNLKKRINPKMETNEIEANIPFPGASPLEVEEGIVIKVEEALRGIEGIEEIRSFASEGWARINADINEDYPIDKGIEKIKNAVNAISSFPTDAEKPTVTHELKWNRAIMFTIYGEQDLLTTKQIVYEFRDALLETGKMSRTFMWGMPDREISIEVSPENLIRYKLTIDDISQAVRSSNINISSGSVLTEQEEILIRSYGRKYEAREFEEIEVTSTIDGKKIKLKDIASIEEKWPENRFIAEYNGNQTVYLNVMYNNNEDVVEIVETCERIAAEFEQKYAGLMKFNVTEKETENLEERIDLLTQNGFIGLLLVVIALWIFLNVRLAFWVALGIPISMLGLYFVLWVIGVTINEMSLFGMILVIGILVDDGIIIGESIYSQYEKGKTGRDAAVAGTLDVIQPVTISIITTIVAFVPYFYFYGELGKNVWQIGAVVIICLLFSLVEAIMILPAHIAHSKAIAEKKKSDELAKPTLREKFDARLNKFLYEDYKKFLIWILNYRWTIACSTVTMILLIIGMFQGNHIRAQFFPEIEEPYVRISIEMPSGTSADFASAVRHKVIKKATEFAKLKEEQKMINPIISHSSWMGGTNINVSLRLIEAEKRDYSINDFSDELAEYIGEVPEAENFHVGGIGFGGFPISVKFASQDYTQLHKAKDLFKAELRKIDGVKDIQDDTPLGSNEFIVELKPIAKALGLSLSDVTRQLKQGFYGQEIMRLQKGRDEVKVWARFNEKDRVSVAQIENLKIRTLNGDYVPFKEIATYRIERGIKRIRRVDGYRSVQVYANLDYSKNDLQIILNDLNNEIIPRVFSQVEGVTQSFGGQSEEVDKIQKSIQTSMSIAIVIIFTILVFLLKSYLQSLLIIGLIPLGVVGAVLGHYLMGYPVSILSFLGIVALAGIIINDSVVMVDRYNKLLHKGNTVKDAVLEAGISRFRPIILTTVTTAIGLAPLILERSVQGQFLVPVAVSVAFGLIFGTFITLLVLPSALYCISDLRKFFNAIANKTMDKPKLSRKELEPAYE